jgi:hypothetical protein
MEGNQRQIFLTLTGLQIPVFVTNPRTLEAINISLLQLGELQDTPARRQCCRLASRRTRSCAQPPPEADAYVALVSVQPPMAVGEHFLMSC